MEIGLYGKSSDECSDELRKILTISYIYHKLSIPYRQKKYSTTLACNWITGTKFMSQECQKQVKSGSSMKLNEC